MGKQLVKPDLKRGEPCGRPGCILDLTNGGEGGPHNIPSSLYRGECKLCEAAGERANTGGRVDSPEAIDVELMVQKLLQEKKQMHSQNILRFSTQMT